MPKPVDVVEHKHFFAYPGDEEKDDRRYDACLCADGKAYVYCVHSDMTFYIGTYDRAKVVAENMARSYREIMESDGA